MIVLVAVPGLIVSLPTAYILSARLPIIGERVATFVGSVSGVLLAGCLPRVWLAGARRWKGYHQRCSSHRPLSKATSPHLLIVLVSF